MKFIVLVCVGVIVSMDYVCGNSVHYGSKTLGLDDYTSTVTCPAGEFMISCECDNPGRCDGTTIDTTGTVCTVYNRWFNIHGVKPRVVCSPQKQNGWVVRAPPTGEGNHPTPDCGKGNKPLFCTIHNRAAQHDAGYPHSYVSGSRCIPYPCTTGKCSAQAYCVKA